MDDERQAHYDETGEKGKKTWARVVELSQREPQRTDTDKNTHA
jgi:hypothetical protein